MTTPTYHGDSQVIRVRPHSGGEGGEGPWWWSGTCGYIIVETLMGDTIAVWAGAAPTIGGGSIGSGTVTAIIPGQLYMLTCTATGNIELDASDGNGLLAHQVLPEITICT